jgi:hypothetical protein
MNLSSPWNTAMDIKLSAAVLDTIPARGIGADREGPPGLTAEMEEESLIADARAGLTPAQMVERKLLSLLKTNPLPVSQVMNGSRTFRR